MKIEKTGILPKETVNPAPLPWWVGKRAECPRCHAVITLEITDAPSHYVNFALRCPTKGCGTYIQIRPVFDRTGKIG